MNNIETLLQENLDAYDELRIVALKLAELATSVSPAQREKVQRHAESLSNLVQDSREQYIQLQTFLEETN